MEKEPRPSFSQLNLEATSSSDSDEDVKKFALRDLKECKYFTKKGLPDMRYKENREKFLIKGLKTDGTPDMRISANKKKMNFLYERHYKDL
ncbi:hypothetical protein BpHYR1_050709 [Brachionus plicatilis]|uniref:Uncharacterized protein n=1 Tax=Brachionus plicatilis TaxID=10195 RepID=A0A3M7TA74_BRAPC|nr:hypothetical protein BpHYR1_050709 [Brachionus plicatilis]